MKSVSIKVQGPSGSGKTLVIQEIVKALSAQGFTFDGVKEGSGEDSVAVTFNPVRIIRCKQS